MAFKPHSGGAELPALSEINVTPFIDVMLVLLIIFMVVAPLTTVNLPLDLPVSTSQPDPTPQEPLVVSLKDDLSLSVGEQAVPREALASELERRANGDKDTRVFIRADKQVPYQELITLMDALRAAGYLKVALVGIEPSLD